MIGFILSRQTWLTHLCVVLALFVRMGKTHLEHQLIRILPDSSRNITTPYDPYVNYDPQQGLTTALILGKLLGQTLHLPLRRYQHVHLPDLVHVHVTQHLVPQPMHNSLSSTIG